MVVIHRNRPERLAVTIAALRAQTVPVRIILVDSGSEPEAHRRAVELLDPTDTVVRMGGNGGFGPSANAGWRAALADGATGWIGLCPHDAIVDPDAIERILDAVRDRPAAGLACGDFGDAATPVVDPYFGAILVPATTEHGWDPAHYPHGTLLLARAACLEDVGLFDERYFAYGEEADLGLRARRAGWEVGLVRGARVRNPEMSNNRPVVDYLMVRNTFLLVREHSGRYHVTIRLLIALAQLWTERRTSPYHDVQARLFAIGHFLRGRLGPPPASLVARSLPRLVDP